VAPDASRWQRLAGALVDGLFALAVGFAPAMALHAARLDPFPTEITKAAGMAWMPSSILALFLGLVPDAVQWWLISTSGQTIGKKVARTRIVTLDGQVAGFMNGVLLRAMPVLAVSVVQVLLRTFVPAVGRVASPLLSLLFTVDILFIFGSSRRCVHDYIAGTRVMDTRTWG
jgi:uncharacterized RDD family membrane protein YckC